MPRPQRDPMPNGRPTERVAIACGGTGGHLYPGLAVADVLADRGVETLLLISRKEVDQQAIRALTDVDVATLPGIGLERGRYIAFLRALVGSYRAARALFRERQPGAVLAMGGFTSVAPVLAARTTGTATFLHEANSIPGRANRWLAHVVDQAFVYFPAAAGRLWHAQVQVTGMPVRDQFRPMDSGACRTALGLDAARPVLLATGGSQGASPLNDLVLRCLFTLHVIEPALQFIHLTGPHDAERVRQAYATLQCRAVVRPFLAEMELALGAATVAITRAGASSLAELAAMGLPALLIPFPHAADDHQYHNAQAFVASGAARMLRQDDATPSTLTAQVSELLHNASTRAAIQRALAAWHSPEAADRIANAITQTQQTRQSAPFCPEPGAGTTRRPTAVNTLRVGPETRV